MGSLWRVWLFVLGFSSSGKTVETSSLTKILLDPVLFEKNIAECLYLTVRHPSLNFMANIAINIETESSLSRQEFTSTVERFVALNDRVTMYLDSNEGSDTHGRFYFVDSFRSFELLIKRYRKDDHDSSAERQYYLIILPADVQSPQGTMRQIFQLCWDKSIVNVNILIEDKNGVVEIYTYFPFTAKSCTDRTPVIYNRFFKGIFESNKPVFAPKTKNLWQCPVPGIIYHIPPQVILNRTQVTGFDADIVVNVAKLMNFSVTFIISPHGGGLSENSIGFLSMMNNGLGHFTTATAVEKRFKYYAATGAYRFFSIKLILKLPEPYSPLEVLLFPFDWYTWILLSIIFVGKWIGQILWRRFTNGPVAPNDNFKHSSIIFWLFTMLIVRSSYEGSIFKFLHNQPTKAPPRTINEACNQGYKIIVPISFYHLLNNIPELSNKMIVRSESHAEVVKFFNRLEGKYGLVATDLLIQYHINSTNYKDYFVVPEPILVLFMCFYLHKYSFLANDFGKQLRHMNEHGHTLKMRKPYTPEQFWKKKMQTEPESMSLHHLTGAFQLFVILIALSACVFVIEVLAKKNRRLKAILEAFQ